MTELIFAVLTANIIIFASLGAATWSEARSEPSHPLARSMQAVSLMSWAVTLGAFTQVALTALKLEWLPVGLQDSVTGPWHIAQSLAILGVATIAMASFRRARLAAKRPATGSRTPARSSRG